LAPVINIVEKKEVPNNLKGEGGTCLMLRPEGKGKTTFGCAAKGYGMECPLLAEKPGPGGSQCTNYSETKPNGKQNDAVHPTDLSIKSLVAVKASEAEQCLGAISYIVPGHGCC